MNKDIQELNNKSKEYSEKINIIRQEIKKVIVGQDEIIDKLLLGLIAKGHILMEGVPGLAKTLMIKTLANTVGVKYNRIQFTPDLLPADIIGTRIFNMKDNSFSTKKGPIFSNFILADEINRAPPKCQSALLEAMQEKQVTIGEESYLLEPPFFVMATQNPLEHEGVYTLPEAQVDRFMFKIIIRYPNKDEEIQILDRMTEGNIINVKEGMKKKDLLEIQQFNEKIYSDEKIKNYCAEIVNLTRNSKDLDINGLIEYGASPRATIWLNLAGKANAMINGRGYVIPEDIQEIAYEVLRHRIILSYEAEAENITTDDIIKKILEKVKIP